MTVSADYHGIIVLANTQTAHVGDSNPKFHFGEHGYLCHQPENMTISLLGTPIVGSYNYFLVAVSVMIAMLASYAALDLSGRVTAAVGAARFVWLTGGATAMVIGIWSMHYVGMLAFQMPVTVLHNVSTVSLSLLAAIFSSAVAMFVVSWRRTSWIQILAATPAMGRGIAAMHYTGMVAATFSSTPARPELSHALNISSLSTVAIIIVTLVILGLALLTSAIDRRFSAQTLDLQASEQRLCQLVESVDVIVWRRGAHNLRLRQVIANLTGNAIEFTERGEVALQVECESQDQDWLTLKFTVRDTGIGIALEKQRLVFQPFTQADGSRVRRFGGTGLGLTISSRLVDMMHGRIWLESELGRGSRFYFTAKFGMPRNTEKASAVNLPVVMVDDNFHQSGA